MIRSLHIFKPERINADSLKLVPFSPWLAAEELVVKILTADGAKTCDAGQEFVAVIGQRMLGTRTRSLSRRS